MKETDTREFSGAAVNVIAQGTQLQGNMVTASDCRIDGMLRGNIESKAKIIVGRSGVVEGNIKCANIEIEGTVKAESLLVSELVSLKNTANLIGNIETGKIANMIVLDHNPLKTPDSEIGKITPVMAVFDGKLIQE